MGFCLDNLCTLRVSLADRKQHSDGDMLSYDRLSGRNRAGVTQECREMIHITNQYLLHSFSAITLAVSVCVTGTVVEIPLTLCMDRLLEPLRSDFNHILWLFSVTRMRYCYLQEILSHLCLLFLDTNFLYKEETLQHIISSQE